METSVNIHIWIGHTFNHTDYLLVNFLITCKIKFYLALYVEFLFPNTASRKKVGNLKITNKAKYFTRMNIHITSSTKHPVFSVQGI
jgi:hypothetical protein